MSQESGERPPDQESIDPDLLAVIRAIETKRRGEYSTAEDNQASEGFSLVRRRGLPPWVSPTIVAGAVGVSLFILATAGGRCDLATTFLAPAIPASPTPLQRPQPTVTPTLGPFKPLIIPTAVPFPTLARGSGG